MSEPFLAEIKIVGFNFAPRGWAFCDGQILPINQNQSLFALLGTTFGGDGRTSFALPDLRSRAPISIGNGMQWGEKGGQENETLTLPQIPSHDHTLKAANVTATTNLPAPVPPDTTPKVFANASVDAYETFAAANQVNLNTGAVTTTGGGQGHDNMQPYLPLGFVIALQGLFPSRN